MAITHVVRLNVQYLPQNVELSIKYSSRVEVCQNSAVVNQMYTITVHH